MADKLMIDYTDEYTGKFVRRVIDRMEFCIRYGIAYFESGGTSYSIPVENISQMFTTRA